MKKLLPLLVAFPCLGSASGPITADIAWIAEGGFCEPETVLPLPDDTLLVSNVCDFAETENGFLTLLKADGSVIEWRILEGLDAPLGMALHNGQLHVVDNNRVKVFRWPGYELIKTVTLETKVANDIAVGADDTIYVTDSARGEVVAIDARLEQSILTGEPQFPGANGIHVNQDDLWVGGGRLWHVDLRDDTVTTVGPVFMGGIDGIEQERDGTLQVTPVGGPLIRLKDTIEIHDADVISSANHGYAESLGLVLIPTGFDNTVIAIRVN
jgi:sugar lactone lactonase YvrE